MPRLVWAAIAGLVFFACATQAQAQARPNLVVISCEDTSPWLGFNGERYATTPNLDRLAAQGVSYSHAFVTAPVCSPCRFAMITSCYATSYGAQHLRSTFSIPGTLLGYPTYLRRAGYYTTNNVKTDYNTSAEKRLIAESWDECSPRAHHRNRKPGQPFFAVYNLTETHQSQAFESTRAPDIGDATPHDPAAAPLPPSYPDTPTARRTMARVHDCITAMDRRAGAILDELERDGLAGDTIVIFFSDHGQGIPRGKRTLWDTGTRVPLVFRFPEKFKHLAPAAAGATVDRMVSLMDLGPTFLSLAGLAAPPGIHGQAFLGPHAAAPRTVIFSARDRIDEAIELSRCVRDARWLYIRNYRPDVSWLAPEWYSDQLGLRRELVQLAAAGRLNEAQMTFAGPTKPAEALYDTQADPWQLRNLAGEAAHAATLERMRAELRRWQLDTRDLAFLPEAEAARLEASSGKPLIEAARDKAAYPLARILDIADRVGRPGQVDAVAKALDDPHPAVRFWAVVGLRCAGPDAAVAKDAIRNRLADGSLPVRTEAAGALVRLGDAAALDVLTATLAGDDPRAALHAARTLQLLGPLARDALPSMKAALARAPAKSDLLECLRNATAALEAARAP